MAWLESVEGAVLLGRPQFRTQCRLEPRVVAPERDRSDLTTLHRDGDAGAQVLRRGAQQRVADRRTKLAHPVEPRAGQVHRGRASTVDGLRAHVGGNQGVALAAEAEAHLRRAALRFPVATIVTADGCELHPVGTGIDRSFAYLLAAVADLASRGAWSRVKVCKNDGCYTAFFDKTRNSPALYCSPTCSGQMATRAYRERKKECAAR